MSTIDDDDILDWDYWIETPPPKPRRTIQVSLKRVDSTAKEILTPLPELNVFHRRLEQTLPMQHYKHWPVR